MIILSASLDPIGSTVGSGVYSAGSDPHSVQISPPISAKQLSQSRLLFISIIRYHLLSSAEKFCKQFFYRIFRIGGRRGIFRQLYILPFYGYTAHCLYKFRCTLIPAGISDHHLSIYDMTFRRSYLFPKLIFYYIIILRFFQAPVPVSFVCAVLQCFPFPFIKKSCDKCGGNGSLAAVPLPMTSLFAPSGRWEIHSFV